MSNTNVQKFPNLHSKTAGTVGTVIAFLVYIFCESGIINHA